MGFGLVTLNELEGLNSNYFALLFYRIRQRWEPITSYVEVVGYRAILSATKN